MKTVLVVLPLQERHKQLFKESVSNIEFIFCSEEDLTWDMVLNANAIIGNIPHDLLRGTRKLEWLQLSSAGTDGYLEEGLLPHGTVITNATGAYGLAISEHIFSLLLFLLKKLDRYKKNQEKHEWKDEGTVSSIYGKTTIIVGLGDLGKEFALRMQAFGSYIIGIKRTKGTKPNYVDELYTIEELESQLVRADIVALFLPGTKSTYRMFSKEKLLKIKKGAFLLNAGRGNVIDPEVLSEVMESGHLAGAGIDVTDPEPLPANSKLWNAPNTIITPHVAGGYHLPETLERIVDISIKNLKAFIGNGDFMSVVDYKTGYKLSGK